MDRCFDCHGDQENGNSAPAPAFWAEDDEAGAHQSHLGPSDWHPELVCEDCHIVPEEVLWDGHVDTPLPAELTWGALATTDDATPSWDGTTCADVYCHGATLEVGGASNTEPTWLVVDGTEAECGTCHGLPPEPPHPQREDCSPCHPTADADQEIIITEADRHIDGVLDLEDIECDACHGSDGESAPPLDLAGNIDTSFTGVGAHREHLGASDWHAEVTCDECHLEPMKLDDPGHVDSDPPAELTWGMLAAADMATPSWDGMSCSGVYCHGATLLPGGSNTEPTWTVVDGTEADCGTCHGLPPDPPHPAPTDCSLCHPTADSTPDIVDPDLHINGVVDLGMPDCDACHGSGGTRPRLPTSPGTPSPRPWGSAPTRSICRPRPGVHRSRATSATSSRWTGSTRATSIRPCRRS